MKFVADCMLGMLAKWLRLVGCDTVYIHGAADDELVRLAVREDRILLTRDGELAGRRMVRARSLFIESGETREQLRQVMKQFGIEPRSDYMFTRCTVCNGEIGAVPKALIEDKVPPYVYQTQEEFGWCRSCDRIYWRGTHVEHVLAALARSKDKESTG